MAADVTWGAAGRATMAACRLPTARWMWERAVGGMGRACCCGRRGLWKGGGLGGEQWRWGGSHKRAGSGLLEVFQGGGGAVAEGQGALEGGAAGEIEIDHQPKPRMSTIRETVASSRCQFLQLLLRCHWVNISPFTYRTCGH